MAYEKKFVNPYPDGWIDLPEEETPVDAEAMQKITDGIEGIDNYLSENPPDELKESLIQFKDDGFLPKNLCNKFDLVQGAFNSSGADTQATNGIRTPYIEIKPNTQYSISAGYEGKCYFREFTSKGTESIYASGWQPLPFTFTSKASTKYIRVMFANDAITNINVSDVINPQIEEGNQPSEYIGYAISNQGLTQIVEYAKADGYIQNKNLFNWNDLVVGKKFQSTTIINDENWSIAYIPYKLGKPISISGYANVGLSGGIGFADANKNIIEVVQTQSVGGTYSTSNPNAKYFCASVVSNSALGAYRHDMQIEYGSVSSYVERVPSNTELKQSLTPINVTMTSANSNLVINRYTAKKVNGIVRFNARITVNASFYATSAITFSETCKDTDGWAYCNGTYFSSTPKNVGVRVQNSTLQIFVDGDGTIPSGEYWINGEFSA